jgi:two-component system sensor histidine kinase KdpD
MSDFGSKGFGTQFLVATGAIGLAVVVGLLLRPWLAEADIVMIFLLAVVSVGLRFRAAPSLYTAVISVAAFDFFFVAPNFTFAIHESKYIITFLVMAVIGVTVTTVAQQERRTREAVRVAELDAERERLLNAILNSVSHDLRTPLATIIGAASSLRMPDVQLSCGQENELLATIQEEAFRLSRRVENLLDMAKIHAEHGRIRTQWHVPEELVGLALSQLESRLTNRSISIAFDPPNTLIRCDAGLIELALMNLIENATRHTPTGTPLEILGKGSEGTYAFTISDHGPGLRECEKGKLFGQFQRGATSDRSGSGLGLAIVKTVVEAHGGQVSVVNRNVGSGAAFSISLPWTAEAQGEAHHAFQQHGAEGVNEP